MRDAENKHQSVKQHAPSEKAAAASPPAPQQELGSRLQSLLIRILMTWEAQCSSMTKLRFKNKSANGNPNDFWELKV